LDLKAYLEEKRAFVDRAIQGYLPEPEGPTATVVEAMKYSLLAGGKRLRPILCLAACSAVGGQEADILPVACALEFIHSYSLIHDDLPVMDDDDLRRGRATNHKVFGEAVALLAGDGLLTEAFALMTARGLAEKVPPSIVIRVINLIAEAAGFRGMVGGQTVDIQTEGKRIDVATLEYMHRRKTGALIAAAVTSGCLLGGGDDVQISRMADYGGRVGLAFQISDDILDIEGDPTVMGKGSGSDARKGKNTYPAVVGLARSKEIQGRLIQEAISCLDGFNPGADPLREIARYIVERKK
jgi:geranylgeranyl diphosphate synthase type II